MLANLKEDSTHEAMDEKSRRNLGRDSGVAVNYPVSCQIHFQEMDFRAEILNYHFGGACLKLPNTEGSKRLLTLATDQTYLQKNQHPPTLDFYLGQMCIQRDIPFKICWVDMNEVITLGVQFLAKVSSQKERAERFPINRTIPITASATDPLDPNRQVFFQGVDVSETGLLLRTSLTNKHLLPGMKLTATKLMIPPQEALSLSLEIENTRRGSDENSFLLGVTVRSMQEDYIAAMRQYLSIAIPQLTNIEEHLSKLQQSRFLSKSLKSGITYRVVQSEKDYESVLKLRFNGYGKHSKLKAGTTWQDQGEGLKKEGLILAGFLGSRMVCSMELRFGSNDLPLRTLKLLNTNQIQGVDTKRVVEINKLVVIPEAQGSDIVLGMIQKAHTIVVNQGQIDVLLVATDKLKPLYERIGAECVGTAVPHPHLEGQFLNPMIVRREVYHDGLRYNPHAWSVVYQTVHEHFAQIGMTKSRRFSALEKIKMGLSKELLKIKKPKKSSKGSKQKNNTPTKPLSNESTHPKSKKHRYFIDPKWTRQEIVATVMRPYIREAADMIGQEKVDQILSEIGVPESYLTVQNNWLSIMFHDEFLNLFSKYGDPLELSKRAGIRSMQKDMLGFNYYVLKHFLSPEIAFLSFSKIMQKFNRTRTYNVVESGPGRVKIQIGLVAKELLPKVEASCMNWQSSFVAYCELMTSVPGRVKKTSCCYHGDEHCSYEVQWETTYHKLVKIVPFALIIAAGFLSWTSLKENHDPTTVILAPLLSITSILLVHNYLKYLWIKRHNKVSYEEFMKYQVDASEKYAELQQAKTTSDDLYREGRLVEDTMRDIQKKDDAQHVLQTALDSLCRNFSFERSFAMLIDPDKKKLRTAAVAGIKEGAEKLWGYQVNVNTKRDNTLLLSSVFFSGNSVVIDNVSEHMFQLNEASRQLLQAFGSLGFIMVSIPARTGSWGVIIVDFTSRGRRLSRRDAVVIERLSQQIGLALDKQADLEREKTLRGQFQKYAPSALIYATNADSNEGKETSALGAKQKEVGALFVDIRGFTTLADALPPAKTFEILGGLFSRVDQAVRAYDGVIDKYLGDGALALWGTLGSSEPDAKKILSCIDAILKSVEEYGDLLENQGIKRLKIGIGAHLGPAIVGTIGSNERLEYTAIGPAINLASRLEGLCKMLNSKVVISEKMALEAGLSSKDLNTEKTNWSTQSDVQVRGLTEAVNVWFLQEKSTRIDPPKRKAA